MNRVFDSSGPEGKVRGTPQQIIEKYQFLARDAQLGNDRIAAENFQQHAEHYTRMLAQAQREQAAEQEARRQQQEEQRARHDDRGRQNNGQNNGQNNNQNGGQPSQDTRGHAQRANEQPAQPRAATPQPSGAFDVASGPTEDNSPLVVDTPENHDTPTTDAASAAEQPADAPAKPRNTRKPRAPKAEGEQAAPKRSRAPRKPRAPKPDAEPAAAPDVKSSAVE